MCLAVDLAELADNVHGAAIGCDGVDEVVDVGSERAVEPAAVGVVRGDEGLVDRATTYIADLGEVPNHDDAVAHDDAIEHLAVEHLHRVRARYLTDPRSCLAARRQCEATNDEADRRENNKDRTQSTAKHVHRTSLVRATLWPDLPPDLEDNLDSGVGVSRDQRFLRSQVSRSRVPPS